MNPAIAMQISFKVAEYIDIDRLMPLVEEFYQYDGVPFSEPVVQAVVGFLSDDAFGRAWLICAGEEAIGYVVLVYGYSLELHGRDAFVDELFLRAPYRGKGIGTMTIAFVEDYARTVGIKAVHLEVMHDNRKALEFYRKLGYQARDRLVLSKKV